MQLWIQDDEGQLVASYINGELLANGFFDKDKYAFELWKLVNRLTSMSSDAGGAVGQSLSEAGDSDFGTAEDPSA